MNATVFVDTNVLIYALDPTDLVKQRAAQAWRSDLWNRESGRTSFQVLQEFYAKVIYKWPSARKEARDEVRDLLAWRPVSVSADILDNAWTFQDRYQLSFWDALIVAAAKSVLPISPHRSLPLRTKSRRAYRYKSIPERSWFAFLVVHGRSASAEHSAALCRRWALESVL
jgi:predicted nucleic acid-binding protein